MSVNAARDVRAVLSAASYAPGKKRVARSHGLRVIVARATQAFDFDARVQWHGTCDCSWREGALARPLDASYVAPGWNLRSRFDFQ